VKLIESSIYRSLREHLFRPEVTVITGMRRTGKTAALTYLLDQVGHGNKLYLDLERLEYRRIFLQDSFAAMEADLSFLGYDFSRSGVIALDEVQLVPEVVSFIKYYHDHHQVKFLLSGSSSYYLKDRITESLSGRKQVFVMGPLDFPEFLSFRGVDATSLVPERLRAFRPLVFERFGRYYEEYLQYGGFPQVVLEDDPARKTALLKDILQSYLELDVKLLSDYSVIDDLYRLALMLSSRVGGKLDYQKLAVLTGLNRHKVRDYVQLFEATYFLKLIRPFANSPDRAIAVQPKVYFSDHGMVGQLGQVHSGALFENALAVQLSHFGSVRYFQKKSGQEIDFILDGVQAVEVKETPFPSDLVTLQKRARSIGLEKVMLIARKPPQGDFRDFVWGGVVF
jgi:uncharacterized protein